MAEPARITRRGLVDQVHVTLKGRILDQVHKPDEWLNISALALELGVSSTPVREALARLTAEGLVVASSHVGFTVAPMPDAQWFEDLYTYRLLVEPWAASEMARRRPAEPLADLLAAMAALSGGHYGSAFNEYRSALHADEAFHRAVVDGAGNRVVARSYRDLNPHLHFARLYIARRQDDARVIAEHRVVADAILEGDPARAERDMRAHLDAARARLAGHDDPIQQPRAGGTE